MTKLAHLHLENFTAFAQLDVKFSPGVNVLVGANGTGKTHLLKLLYTACAITGGEAQDKTFGQKLVGVFRPYEGRIGRLARRQSSSVTTQIDVRRQGPGRLSVQFSNHSKRSEDISISGEEGWTRPPLVSAFIPVKEMLAHAPGFLATVSKREMAFEDIYPDIITQAYLPKLSGPKASRLLGLLEQAIDGKVITKGEHFFLKNRQGDLEFSLLAEGMRKLALIWLLIQNGTLWDGNILFWDEPEANLNPALMGAVVDVILELQRLGVQVFLSTHNYVLLKEFDLRAQAKDQVRYFGLFRGKDDSVQCQGTDSYRNIAPNAIADTFADLLDRDIARGLKAKG